MTFPSFTEFYVAIHQRAPLPWQARLADEVLERGWAGLLLDLPTGTGKTSALDVALYCLARAPDRMPRRTLLVVDRRIVVDQGASHARHLQHALVTATDGAGKAVADALRAMFAAAADEPPFSVALMRGGMPRDDDWARRPDQPVLGVSTVDQVGSRLLFRGYGLSPRSASIHAGLLGNDTLVLLDEVHLAVPFAQTLEVIGSRFRTPHAGLPARFAVVRMSATAASAGSTSRKFGLAADDHAHPVLARRLAASKRARMVTVKVTGDDEAKKREALARRAVGEAIELQAQGARVVGIVVNRVDTARLAQRMLDHDHGATTRSILVTGRMRPLDRDRLVREILLPLAGAQRTREADAPLVVVATQCIEAGADLDFDGLVTECASLDALRQRFGRVDRRGERGSTSSVILGRSDQVQPGADDPVYGGALGATWAWLAMNAREGIVDFGITALSPATDASGGPLAGVLAPVSDAPVMLPAHLEAWAHTSLRPTPDPDVSHWLHGPAKPAADVQIVWRALPGGAGDGDVEAEARSIDEVAAVRPSSLEAITVPLGAARRWLAGDAPSAVADVMAGDAEGSEEDEPWRRRSKASEPASSRVMRWAGDDSAWIPPTAIRPGDVLVVDVARGGISAASFDPEGALGVVDLGDLAQLRARAIATLRLQPEALRAWQLPEDVVASLPRPEPEESTTDYQGRVEQWFQSFPDARPDRFVGTDAEWRAALAAWRSRRLRIVLVDGLPIATAPVPRRHLMPEIGELLTEDDDSSFRAVEVTLTAHGGDVRALAERYARSLGLDEKLVTDVGIAAWLHDVGKADPRFQRWLVGGSEIRAALQDDLLAKSALPPGNAAQRRRARARAGYPEGYRHELLSLAMVQGSEAHLSRAHDPDLVLHLIGSHHGWCRPFAPPVDDPEDLPVQLEMEGGTLSSSTRHRLARLDSGIIDRFWRLNDRYGWWGLAWLEAILRLADHRASEAAQTAEGA